MKALKIFTAIIFIIGMMLIITEAGMDDLMVMELHQDHDLNFIKLCFGILMMLPLPYALSMERNRNGK